jgi:hypothetical protein
MISRHSLGIALALLAVSASRAPGQDTDAALTAAIRSYAPEMALSSDPGLVHAADFNGDGRQDVAAVLVGGGKSALVIFNGTRSGYQAHALYAVLPAGPWQLNVVPPGRHRILGPEGAVEISSPAVELVFPGRSSAMYAWGGNRYQVYGTENYH